VDWRPDLQNEVQDAEEPEAGRRGCWEHQEARPTVLLGEDGALPFRAVPPLDEEQTQPAVLVVTDHGIRCRLGSISSRCARSGGPNRKSCGEVWKETGKWKSRWKIRDLLADGRCRQAALDFLSATDVGKLVRRGRCGE